MSCLCEESAFDINTRIVSKWINVNHDYSFVCQNFKPNLRNQRKKLDAVKALGAPGCERGKGKRAYRQSIENVKNKSTEY